MNTTISKKLSAFAVAGVLSLSLAACGGGDDTDPAPAPSNNSSSPSESPSDGMSEGTEGAASQVFGPACGDVPTDGPGSFDGMVQDPVATAASNNPALSTLVDAVTAADLADTLNTTEDITVFAPANPAFEAIPQDQLGALLKDKEGLTNVLTYHVVPGQLTPDQLAGDHKTLQGETLTVEGSGEDFTVNGDAAVVCGNVPTANATVYIIDGVLMPSM